MPANKRLTVEVVDSELRISVGISRLKDSVEHPVDSRLTHYDEEQDEYLGFKIIDEKIFAKDVCRALQDEEEDGTTPVDILLDSAILSAIEEGSLAVAEEMEIIKW